MEVSASYCACSPASLHGNQALKVKRWTIGGLCWVTRTSNPCSHICHYFPQSVTCFSLLNVLFSLAEDSHSEADPPRLSSKETSCCDRTVCPKKIHPIFQFAPRLLLKVTKAVFKGGASTVVAQVWFQARPAGVALKPPRTHISTICVRQSVNKQHRLSEATVKRNERERERERHQCGESERRRERERERERERDQRRFCGK